MDIVLVGLNHKTAPVDIRECFAFDSLEADAGLKELSRIPELTEAVLISTCNRVEIAAACQDPDEGIAAIKDFFSRTKSMPLENFEQNLFVYKGDEAVQHVFRVASSLDSMVLGEPQILGQMKESYRLATQAKTTGAVLNRLMHRCFMTAKRVRKETGIGDHAVSISYAAVELARKIFGELTDKKVLLIGAGEMAELAVEHLLNHRAAGVFVANRTFERAVALAERFRGTPIRLEEVEEHLKIADIIISSTGAPGYVLEKKDVKKVLRARKNRPLFFIDIAVPRDIDPAINNLSNNFVYDIDDLQGVIDRNIDERQKEAVRAERIVDENVIKYRTWLEGLDIVPTIVSLQKKLEAIRQAEMAKSLANIPEIDEKGREAIERLTQSIINKVMHDPIQFLKAGGHREKQKKEVLGFTRDIFNLNNPQNGDEFTPDEE
ncbi:glutamyl-tRNA reductase [Desulfatibacillum aliphaticivorans]|uniref:Glutamyl-tRNA reductase n=1 Tax=Desulfatibacillum aliphaticivorans TaxID=218208 RepID=HEM1_DESAL|nr:glutamyl-tRNA reductase [Desulfatibacillum aliphaticivorans]B8FLI1.1 RecName: Full=Glutamyl-tRNA reductase; Short=GluTR [Desulfatibacillum aliphaticivorans]ACL05127.1 glutamyl-tRNA reductase [Desulfatibacillum aliphaticivorans]